MCGRHDGVASVFSIWSLPSVFGASPCLGCEAMWSLTQVMESEQQRESHSDGDASQGSEDSALWYDEGTISAGALFEYTQRRRTAADCSPTQVAFLLSEGEEHAESDDSSTWYDDADDRGLLAKHRAPQSGRRKRHRHRRSPRASRPGGSSPVCIGQSSCLLLRPVFVPGSGGFTRMGCS